MLDKIPRVCYTIIRKREGHPTKNQKGIKNNGYYDEQAEQQERHRPLRNRDERDWQGGILRDLHGRRVHEPFHQQEGSDFGVEGLRGLLRSSPFFCS